MAHSLGIARIAFVLFLVSALSAQTFESVSVTKSTTHNNGAASAELPPQTDPTHLTYTGVTLDAVIAKAYGLRPDQITGPKWLNDDRFDITATLPSGATQEQIPAMLQHLLATRFSMTAHQETKPRTFYALVVAKGGVKMESTQAPEIGPTRDLNSENITLQNFTMVAFAKFLTNSMGMPVVDETGLKDSFNIRLYVPMSDIKSARAIGAIHQLGLNLEKRTATATQLIVDKVER